MRRSDGRLLKSIGTFTKMIPYIMTRRSDAQIFFKQVIEMEKIDAYLREKRRQDQDISHLHFFIAVYVRLMASRPRLNRFVMNNRLYARNGIFLSMTVKHSLNDEAEETTVKFAFTGRESIFEIAQIVDQRISESLSTVEPNNVDKIVSLLMELPIKKASVGVLKFMDKYNLLPQSIIAVSPFHTSLFLTYLKSIKLDYIYHHLYDFGTTGIFVALGQIKKMPVAENDTVVIKKCCEIGYTLDERICDGLYFANTQKLVKKFFENPYLLENCLIETVKDVE